MPKVAPLLFQEGELAPAPDSISQAAFDAWNESAKQFGWPEGLYLTSGRPAKLRRAVKDVGGLVAWKALLAECGKSDFLCGRTQSRDRKPFLLKLDWLLAPANLLKVMERNYFEKPAEVPIGIGNRAVPRASQDWRGRLERYKPNGFWHPETDGPRPEHAGPHLAPAEMIAAWRQRHGIVEKVSAADETRETRLAGMITSYRKVGNWARANDLELELAGIEKRPPTLVPAPDASRIGMPPRPDFRPQRPHSMAGHNRPPGPITDVDEDPGWDSVPEGDEALAEP